MKDTLIKFAIIVGMLTPFLFVSYVATQVMCEKKPIPPTPFQVEIEPWFADFWLDSIVYKDLVNICVEQNPDRTIDYCKCLAATGVNTINNSHNKYTERIWKHNSKTIIKIIKERNENNRIIR